MTRPDIVWIYCDELRADALGCYGNPRIRPHTPNIDRIAARGVRFTRNYCNSPVCVSSRVCVLTGMHPEKTGVYNNEGAWGRFRLSRMPDTFPAMMARHGYRTANFGKIHVAHEMHPGRTPGYEIFQHHNGEGSDMGFWRGLGEDAVGMIRAPGGSGLFGMHGGVYPDGEPYPPARVARNALEWMESARSPCLVRVSLTQPHTPVLPPASFVRLLEGQDPSLPEQLPETASAFERRIAEITRLDLMDPEKLRAARLHYHALVAWVDSQVGLVLEHLERTRRLDRTLIVFGADHGTHIGDYGAFEKHSFAPSAHRVPLLFSWPGRLPGGEVRGDICDSLDIGPTLLALAGIEPAAHFTGRDLFASSAPEAVFSTIGFGKPGSRKAPNAGGGHWYGDRGWPRRGCVRTDRFRLDKNVLIDGRRPGPEDEDVFLADTLADPGETLNLAADPAFAEVVSDLTARLDRHSEGAVEVPDDCVLQED